MKENIGELKETASIPETFKDVWEKLQTRISITQKCISFLGNLSTKEDVTYDWNREANYYSDSLNFLSSELTGVRMAAEALGRNCVVAYKNGVHEEEIAHSEKQMQNTIQKVIDHISTTNSLHEKALANEPAWTTLKKQIANW